MEYVDNHDDKYASKGVAGAGLGLGIAGTALGLFASHNGMNLFGNNCQTNDLAMENAQLKAERYSDNAAELSRQQLLTNWLKPLADEAAANKVEIATIKAEVEKNKEICDLKMELAEQKSATAQAVTNGAIGSLMNQVAALQSLTKCIIPITNVCPEPMKAYNSWTAPTTNTTT